MNGSFKKPLTIAIIAAAAVIAAVVVLALSVNGRNNNGTVPQKQTESARLEAVVQPSDTELHTSQSAATVSVPSESASEADLDGEATTIPDIALPAADGEITHFSRAYVPDARVEDIQLGTVLPLRELFGEGSADASSVFNEDGTFTDTLGAGQVKTGRYNVTNGVLNAIALPDETMDITVTEWDADGKAPVTFCVVYRMGDNRGYRVFYAEKV